MSDQKWDWEDLKKMKQATIMGLDTDSQKLYKAADMIEDVLKTLTEAFQNHIGKDDKTMYGTGVSPISAPAKLNRSMHEVRLVAECLEEIKKHI